jgi:hypothetical protein
MPVRFFAWASRESRRYRRPLKTQPYVMVAAGILLTAFGSAYYHWAPDNARLVWDRLPMTIAFMGVVSAMIAERISIRLGLWLVPLLLVIGISSVVQWHLSEMRGDGDLRFYAAVQVYGVLVPLLVLFLPAIRELPISRSWPVGTSLPSFSRPLISRFLLPRDTLSAAIR